MKRVLITGANRGIGLELARRCLERGDQVFATCRRSEAASDLQALATSHGDRLSVLPLDVTDEATIGAAREAVAAQVDGLDALFNNAGIFLRGEQPQTLSAATMLGTLHVNAVGPLLVAQRFLDLLRAGQQPRIVNITSQLGSLARKLSGSCYSYCGSKAALNMFSKALAFDLKPAGIIVVMIHPGWARTGMGGENAPIMPGESAQGILDVTDRLTTPALRAGASVEDTARFLDFLGRQLPW